MDQLHRELDWINVMAYDFYNSLTPTTGHHAGLYRAATAPDSSRWADASVTQHLEAGVLESLEPEVFGTETRRGRFIDELRKRTVIK